MLDRLDLSEPLGAFELTGRRWCVLEMAPSSGIEVTFLQDVSVCLPLDGECILRVPNSEPIKIGAGDARFVMPGVAHAVTLSNDCSLEDARLSHLPEIFEVDRPAAVRIGKQPAGARILYGQLGTNWPAGLRRDLLPQVLSRDSTGAGSSLSSLVLATVQDVLADAGAAALLTRLATLTMAISLRMHPGCSSFFELGAAQARMVRAKQLIAADHSATWTVRELAHRLGMGRSSFSAYFKSEVGKSPMAYIAEQRMLHAAMLLRSGNLKISEIAMRVGYESEQTFYRCFKAHFGLSPGQMRVNSRQPS